MSRALAVRWPASGLVALAVAALLAGNATGRGGLAAAVVVVQLALVLAWLALFGAQPDAAVLVGFAVVAADVIVLHDRTATPGPIAGVIGVSVVVMLLHQLVRRDPRSVTAAICSAVGAVVLACALVLLLPLHELTTGRSAVLVGVLASGAALVVARLLPGSSLDPLPDGLRRLAGLAVGAGVAALCGLPSGGLAVGDAIGVGAGAAAAALLTDRVLSRVARPSDPEPHRRGYADVLLPVMALLPIALASPVAYLAGRVIAGGAG